MTIFRFKNQFLLSGTLYEYQIKIDNDFIKAKCNIKCKNKYTICYFNISKKDKKRYYEFIGTFGIPHEWFNDDQKYKILTDIASSSLGGLIIVNNKKYYVKGSKNALKLVVGGSISQWHNQTIFNAKFVDFSYKIDSLKITVEAAYIGNDIFYNKTKLIKIDRQDNVFQNGYIYELSLDYKCEMNDDFCSPKLIIDKATRKNKKASYNNAKSLVRDYLFNELSVI